MRFSFSLCTTLTLAIVSGGLTSCTRDPSMGSGDVAGTGATSGASGGATAASGGTTAASAGGPSFGNAGTTVGNPPTSQAGTGAAAVSGSSSAGNGCATGMFCRPPDPESGCGMVDFVPTEKMTTTPGNLLIIFDQSGSMNDNWSNTTKLAAAKDALIAAITPLKDLLNVGAIFLPDPAVACTRDMTASAVQPIGGNGNIPLTPGPAFLQAFDAHWAALAGMPLGAGTPLNEAFDRADVALQAITPTLVGKLAVLVFTDGQPNCTPNPAVTGIPTLTEPQRAANWLVSGMQTFMVGLPGAQGVQLLDDVAINGGTQHYLTPDDPAALGAKLKEVIQQQVMTGFDSCSIDLVPAATEAAKLKLIVEVPNMPGSLMSVEHDLGTQGGWSVTPDGSHVDLNGDICKAAKAGAFTKLTFRYGCKDIPPLITIPVT